MTFTVNILPLIIGAVFNMVLGALWYSPVLFAKPWMKEADIKQEDIESTDGMGKVYAFTTLFAFIASYVIGFLIVNLGITSIWNAIHIGAIVWVGTSLPMVVKNWGFEGRSIKLGLINHGYDLVVYIVVAVLFVLL